MKTIYTTHPVDPEVKAEIRSKGGKIIDARFAPEGEEIIDGQTGAAVKAEKPKADPKPKAPAAKE